MHAFVCDRIWVSGKSLRILIVYSDLCAHNDIKRSTHGIYGPDRFCSHCAATGISIIWIYALRVHKIYWRSRTEYAVWAACIFGCATASKMCGVSSCIQYIGLITDGVDKNAEFHIAGFAYARAAIDATQEFSNSNCRGMRWQMQLELPETTNAVYTNHCMGRFGASMPA